MIAEEFNNLVRSAAVSKVLTGFVYSRHTGKISTSSIMALPPALKYLREPCPLIFFPLDSTPTILERNFRKDAEELSHLKWFNLHFCVKVSSCSLNTGHSNSAPPLAGSVGLGAHPTPQGRGCSLQMLLLCPCGQGPCQWPWLPNTKKLHKNMCWASLQ